MRSHYCGDIQSSDIGAEVEISGWVHKRRDHGGVIFLDIRDLHGIVQVVFNPESKDTFDLADSCRSEFVINIKGLVRARIEGAINPKMATGEIEIEAQSLIIYSTALTPKFVGVTIGPNSWSFSSHAVTTSMERNSIDKYFKFFIIS